MKPWTTFMLLYGLKEGGASDLHLTGWHAAMRAQIAMVQLRTRKVRLPVPSQRQLDSARKILSTFEEQGFPETFRLPFAPGCFDQRINDDNTSKYYECKLLCICLYHTKFLYMLISLKRLLGDAQHCEGCGGRRGTQPRRPRSRATPSPVCQALAPR